MKFKKKYSEEEIIEIAKSEKVENIVEKVIKKEKKKKFEFSVEDLIEHGKKELEYEYLDENARKFHEYTIAMLEFELSSAKTGTKGFAVLMMRQIAKKNAQDMLIKHVRPLKKAVAMRYSGYDKKTLEGFYYRTGKRYLVILGFR